MTTSTKGVGANKHVIVSPITKPERNTIIDETSSGRLAKKLSMYTDGSLPTHDRVKDYGAGSPAVMHAPSTKRYLAHAHASNHSKHGSMALGSSHGKKMQLLQSIHHSIDQLSNPRNTRQKNNQTGLTSKRVSGEHRSSNLSSRNEVQQLLDPAGQMASNTSRDIYYQNSHNKMNGSQDQRAPAASLKGKPLAPVLRAKPGQYSLQQQSLAGPAGDYDTPGEYCDSPSHQIVKLRGAPGGDDRKLIQSQVVVGKLNQTDEALNLSARLASEQMPQTKGNAATTHSLQDVVDQVIVSTKAGGGDHNQSSDRHHQQHYLAIPKSGATSNTAKGSSVHLLTQRQHSVGVKFPVIAQVQHSLKNLESVLAQHRKSSHNNTSKYGGALQYLGPNAQFKRKAGGQRKQQQSVGAAAGSIGVKRSSQGSGVATNSATGQPKDNLYLPGSVDDLKLKQRALHREIIGFSQSVNEKSSGVGRGQPQKKSSLIVSRQYAKGIENTGGSSTVNHDPTVGMHSDRLMNGILVRNESTESMLSKTKKSAKVKDVDEQAPPQATGKQLGNMLVHSPVKKLNLTHVGAAANNSNQNQNRVIKNKRDAERDQERPPSQQLLEQQREEVIEEDQEQMTATIATADSLVRQEHQQQPAGIQQFQNMQQIDQRKKAQQLISSTQQLGADHPLASQQPPYSGSADGSSGVGLLPATATSSGPLAAESSRQQPMISSQAEASLGTGGGLPQIHAPAGIISGQQQVANSQDLSGVAADAQPQQQSQRMMILEQKRPSQGGGAPATIHSSQKQRRRQEQTLHQSPPGSKIADAESALVATQSPTSSKAFRHKTSGYKERRGSPEHLATLSNKQGMSSSGKPGSLSGDHPARQHHQQNNLHQQHGNWTNSSNLNASAGAPKQTHQQILCQSPRSNNFRSNPYSAATKQKTLKQAQRLANQDRQVMQVDYAAPEVSGFNYREDAALGKNFNLSKVAGVSPGQDPAQFVSFQPILPVANLMARGAHGVYDHLLDPMSVNKQPVAQVYKSATRSQAKRPGHHHNVAGVGLRADDGMAAVLRGLGKDAAATNQGLPYQVKLKGTGGKQSSTVKNAMNAKHVQKQMNRSKVSTPANLVNKNGAPRRIQQLAAMSASQQHDQHDTNEHTGGARFTTMNDVADSGPALHSAVMSQQQTQKMPSLTKMNQQMNVKTDTSVQITAARQDKIRRLESDPSKHAAKDGFIATRPNSRGKLRHESIKMATEQSMVSVDGYASQIPPLTSQGKKQSISKGQQVNLSQNVSRAKQRQLDTQEKVEAKRSSSKLHRNLNQLHSRTHHDSQSAKPDEQQSRPTASQKTSQQLQETAGRSHTGPHKQVPEEAEHLKTASFNSAIGDRRDTSSGQNAVAFRAQRKSQAAAKRILKKQLNQGSELATPNVSAGNRAQEKGHGSKLEPITTKESVNLKNNVVHDKRLKSSETCPGHLSPTLPKGTSERLIAKVATVNQPGVVQQPTGSVPQNKAHARRNITTKQTNTIDRSNHQTAASTRKNQNSHEQSFSGVPLSRAQTIRESEAHKVRQAENQAKQQIVQLRNFRQLIDTRRRDHPDQQPLELKDFQINLQVGQGAFAVVRRATHKQTKHVIAIKTYDKKNLQDRETQMAVHREINTLSDLWHPNIMKLHEVVDQRTQVHLIMELCQGMSIFHHIKKMPDQRLPEATCKHIFKQLVKGIAYMHSKGYAHRDLKLDNILMDVATKNIKIIDFGFSQHVRPDEKLNVFCGTPHYMDPDIVRKSPYNGFAADVWACGVILYIIYVGKLPFFGEFEADLFRKIQNGKFTAVPADVGDDKVRSLFRRIFDVNPNTRITAQQCVEHIWLRDAPVDAQHEDDLKQEQHQETATQQTINDENPKTETVSSGKI